MNLIAKLDTISFYFCSSGLVPSGDEECVVAFAVGSDSDLGSVTKVEYDLFGTERKKLSSVKAGDCFYADSWITNPSTLGVVVTIWADNSILCRDRFDLGNECIRQGLTWTRLGAEACQSNKARVLVLVSSSKEKRPVNVLEEWRYIEKELESDGKDTKFELKVVPAPRFNDIVKEISSFKPHLIHFAGHGDQEDIWIQDDDGSEMPLSIEHLKQIAKAVGRGVEGFFLNCCKSKVLAESVIGIGTVDFAIGFGGSIPDDLAIKFSKCFYNFLKGKQDVRQAFNMTVTEFSVKKLGNAIMQPVLCTMDDTSSGIQIPSNKWSRQ
jgi:hypothetical protein